jgi:hypothetical protein|tara:strand:+ start:2443 stop:2715 length:273 start_codon:yes stop_codon:yes gene_type:complete
MKVDDFYDMLPREFWNKVEGFHELENMRQRSDWERTRWSTCLLLNIQLPKNKSIKPKDLIKFEWEKDNKIDFEELKMKAELYKNKVKNGK